MIGYLTDTRRLEWLIVWMHKEVYLHEIEHYT